MSRDDILNPLIAPVSAVQRLLEQCAQNGIIIGGVAAAILGRPRLTADVDALCLIELEDLGALIIAARQEGLSPRIVDAEEFARHHRVLLLRHEVGDTNVDISLGMLPFEIEAVRRGELHGLGPISIRLPTPEDLVIMKAVAHRPKDLLDIEAILSRHPDLDRHRIQHWVQEFAQAMDMPELWDDLRARF